MEKTQNASSSSRTEIVLRLLPLIYFPAATFSHDWVTDVYTRIFKQFGRTTMEWALNWGTVTLLGVVVFMLFSYMKYKGTVHYRDLVIWVFALGCLYGVDYFLICTNIERIHFPQYAILAFLLKMTIRDDFFILFLCTLGGIFDEWVQFVMHPKYTGYLDYNDFILNLIGAVLGLLIFGIFRKESNIDTTSYTKKLKKITYLVTGAALLLIMAGYLSGRIVPYAPLPKKPEVFAIIEGKRRMILSFVRSSDFWVTTKYGRKYHILSPIEGTILMTCLLLFYGKLFSWSKKRMLLQH